MTVGSRKDQIFACFISCFCKLSSVAIVRLQWKDIGKFHVIFRDFFVGIEHNFRKIFNDDLSKKINWKLKKRISVCFCFCLFRDRLYEFSYVCLGPCQTYRNSLPKVFCKKDVFKNFTKFTGKHLCQSLFYN